MSETKKLRVLVIDDTDVFREAFARFMAEVPGVEVVGSASRGEAAFDLVPALKVDLVLLDIFMPGLGGIETARRLKKSPRPPAVVLVTSAHDERIWREARRSGADAVLRKTEIGEAIEPVIRDLCIRLRPN
jgi:DNA-binding NarL/FixJ family response regulator